MLKTSSERCESPEPTIYIEARLQSSSEMWSGSSKVRYLRVLMRTVQDCRVRRHSQVLENFGEPEALHVIDFGGILIVDVPDTRVCNICRQVLLETANGTSCVIQVLGITSHTPSIEIRL